MRSRERPLDALKKLSRNSSRLIMPKKRILISKMGRRGPVRYSRSRGVGLGNSKLVICKQKKIFYFFRSYDVPKTPAFNFIPSTKMLPSDSNYRADCIHMLTGNIEGASVIFLITIIRLRSILWSRLRGMIGS